MQASERKTKGPGNESGQTDIPDAGLVRRYSLCVSRSKIIVRVIILPTTTTNNNNNAFHKHIFYNNN